MFKYEDKITTDTSVTEELSTLTDTPMGTSKSHMANSIDIQTSVGNI